MYRKPSALTLLAISMISILILAACNCAPVLTAIAITPASQTLAIGATQQYTATGYYSNGSVTPNISVSWGSSSAAVATISTSGLATAVGVGTTSITATALGISAAPATLTVNEQLTAITIAPLNQTIAVGGTEQYTATGTYTPSGGGSPTTEDITALVTWTAGNTEIATFSSTTPGLASGVAGGTTTIQASLDGISSATTNLTVNGTILVITPTPTPATIAVGNSISFTVVEQQTGGGTNPTTYPVTWTSSSPGVAGVIANGNSAALGAGFTVGTTTITATENSPIPVTGTLVLTVDAGTAKYAYLSNSGTPFSVASYTATASASPYLAPLTTTTTTSGSPSQTILNPNGQYMYVVQTGNNTTVISTYSIASGTGAITNISPATLPTVDPGGADSTYGIVDPYGRYLYICDVTDSSTTYQNGAIYVYSINQTNGAITQISGSPFFTNINGPVGLLIDHTGSYLYATNSNAGSDNTNGIAAFSITQSTGALVPLSTATYGTGANPEFSTWDPTGTYMFIANGGDETITSYTLGTAGALTAQATTSPIDGALFLNSVSVTPNGSFLYVLDAGAGGSPTPANGAIYAYPLSGGTIGESLTGFPVATGSAPFTISIDPTGKLLAVNDVGDGSDTTTAGVSLYTIGSTGALTTNTAATTGVGPYFVTFYNVP